MYKIICLAICRILMWTCIFTPWIFIFLCATLFDELIAKRELMRRIFWDCLSMIFPDLIVVSSCTNTYGNCVYRYDYDGNKSHIILTIDDCPGDSPIEMKLLLDCLKKHNAKATFFCTTDYISRGGLETHNVMRMLLDDGHELGNHMPADIPYWNMSAKQFEDELDRSEAILKRLDNKPIHMRWFRPPIGKLSDAMMRVLGRKGYRGVVMGDVFSNDPFIGGNRDPPSQPLITYHVLHNLRRARPGSIVVFHCPNVLTRRQLVPILDELLFKWKRQQIECCTLSYYNDSYSKVESQVIN